MNTINNKMLANAALLFVLALLVVILVQWWMSPAYSLTNEEVLARTAHDEVLIKPQQLKILQIQNALKEYTLLDLSGKLEHQTAFGNYLAAPFADLLDADNLKALRKADKLLVVAGQESEAVMAVQLLTAKGIADAAALANDVAFTDHVLANEMDADMFNAHAEKARFDYGRFLKNQSAGAKKASKQAEVPGAVKIVAASGGC